MANSAPSEANKAKAEKTLLLLCNTPDCKTAERIGENLIAAGAAACVNILSPCRSIYRWNGRVERTEETPLLVKTTAASFDAACAVITAAHPDEVPEVIAVDIHAGLPAYLHWVAEQCRPA